jgi:hypothetical protein
MHAKMGYQTVSYRRIIRAVHDQEPTHAAQLVSQFRADPTVIADAVRLMCTASSLRRMQDGRLRVFVSLEHALAALENRGFDLDAAVESPDRLTVPSVGECPGCGRKVDEAAGKITCWGCGALLTVADAG